VSEVEATGLYKVLGEIDRWPLHITGVRAASRRGYLSILRLYPNREELLWLGHLRAAWMPLEFALPPVTLSSNAGWLRVIDTSLPSPEDILEGATEVPIASSRYIVNPRSIVMLHYDYAAKK
jgi:hypothetical protein